MDCIEEWGEDRRISRLEAPPLLEPCRDPISPLPLYPVSGIRRRLRGANALRLADCLSESMKYP